MVDLKTDIFPINYFKSIWSPIQAFKNRKELNWFQLFVVLLFLNSLLTIPVTINYANIDSFPLEDFYPNAVQVVDEEVVIALNNATYQDGKMIIDDPFIIENEHGIIAGDLNSQDEELITAEDNYIIFEENQFIVSDKNAPEASVLYTKDFSLAELVDEKDVVNELSRQWFNQNRILIVLFFSLMISVFLFAMSSLLTFGSAFFLYLTKKSALTSITTYNESVNLILNILSLPTIIAMLGAFIHFDVTLMVTLQMVGLIIMLLVIYFKTNFNDDRLDG